MPNKINTVPLIDTSASMFYNGYVEATIIDAKAFLSKSRPGDGFALARFDANASIAYPGQGLATVDVPRSILRQAYQTIDGLRFDGSATNMGGGIQAARGRLDSVTDPRAIVLLSDGLHNSGTDPLDPGVLPTDYKVHTCAMGPASDQVRMNQIASRTGGKYLYMPRAVDLMRLMNEIRGATPRTYVAHNTLYRFERRNFFQIPVTLEPDKHTAHFGVVWESRRYQWGRQVGPHTLSIYLEDPDGGIHEDAPIDAQPGFALFARTDPKPGEWTVWIEYGGPQEILHTTVGVFELAPEDGTAAELQVEIEGNSEAGEPVSLGIEATAGGEAVQDLRVQVSVQRPQLSLAHACEAYRELLGTVGDLPEDLQAEGLAEDTARLLAARRNLLPEQDLLPTVRRPIPAKKDGSGRITATCGDTQEAGSYTFEIHATGTNPKTGAPFSRSRVLSTIIG